MKSSQFLFYFFTCTGAGYDGMQTLNLIECKGTQGCVSGVLSTEPHGIDKINNRYNLIDTKYRWMARCSDQLDGAVVACLGTPGQTKMSVDRQRATTHEICCLAAELLFIF